MRYSCTCILPALCTILFTRLKDWGGLFCFYGLVKARKETHMLKVHILARCPHCDGQAYLPIGEAESYTGEVYLRYAPCPRCQGSGSVTRWISLQEFADLLEKADLLDAFTPDTDELVQLQPTSQYRDSRDAAGI